MDEQIARQVERQMDGQTDDRDVIPKYWSASVGDTKFNYTVRK